MLLNLTYLVSLHWVRIQQIILYQISSLRSKIPRQCQRTRVARLHDSMRIRCSLVFEWRESAEHFTHENPIAPDVRLIIIADDAHHDLRSQIAGRATVGVSAPIHVLHGLGEAEIYQLNMPSLVYQDVLRL